MAGGVKSRAGLWRHAGFILSARDPGCRDSASKTRMNALRAHPGYLLKSWYRSLARLAVPPGGTSPGRQRFSPRLGFRPRAHR